MSATALSWNLVFFDMVMVSELVVFSIALESYISVLSPLCTTRYVKIACLLCCSGVAPYLFLQLLI